MSKFKLHIPRYFQINTLKAENELIDDIDDYLEETDDFSLFFASTYFVSEQITLIPESFFKITGYGLRWNNYIWYLNDILPEIVDSFKLIKNKKSFSLMFYEQGSERILSFEYLENNKYTSYCIKLSTNENIGFNEYIENEILYVMLFELINEYTEFTKYLYPIIYKNYISPYIIKSIN